MKKYDHPLAVEARPKPDKYRIMQDLAVNIGEFGRVAPTSLVMPSSEGKVSKAVADLLTRSAYPVLNVQYSATALQKEDTNKVDIHGFADEYMEGMFVNCLVSSEDCDVEVLGLNPYESEVAEGPEPTANLQPNLGGLLSTAGMVFPQFAPIASIGSTAVSGLGLAIGKLFRPRKTLFFRAYTSFEEKGLFGWLYGEHEKKSTQGPHFGQVFLRLKRPEDKEKKEVKLRLDVEFVTAWKKARNQAMSGYVELDVDLPPVPKTPIISATSRPQDLPLTVGEADVRKILGIDADALKQLVEDEALRMSGVRITKGSLLKYLGIDVAAGV